MLELVKEHWFCAFLLAFTALITLESVITTFFESWAARGRRPLTLAPDEQEDAQRDDQDDHEVPPSLIELRDQMNLEAQRMNRQPPRTKDLRLDVDCDKDEVVKPKSRFDRI